MMMSRRLSLSITSAVRSISVEEIPEAIRPTLPIDAGTTTIASNTAEPLAEGANIEKIFGMIVRGEVILLMLLCVVMSKWEHCFPSTLELDVEFTEEEVLFQKGKVKRKIAYSQIREVEKIMIINRYHSEKGYYRVKVKTKGMSYAMYSGEESTKALDFSETDVSKVYYEFKRRGIKCC